MVMDDIPKSETSDIKIRIYVHHNEHIECGCYVVIFHHNEHIECGYNDNYVSQMGQVLEGW